MLCLFDYSFFASFVSGAFNKVLLVHRKCCLCFVNLFKKSGVRSVVCGFP